MYESLFKLVQACSNFGTICIGLLQIEQAVLILGPYV